MSYRVLYLIFCWLWCNMAFAQTTVRSEPFTIGETIHFQSDILGEARTLNIYLPESYHPDSVNTYPVIYLLDGSQDEDFIHIAGLVQFGSFSWINMLPESIVVGIANVDRKRDFTFPTSIKQDQQDFPTSGGSAAFMNFLEEELQPLVNGRYRTTDSQTLIGQSLGGLLATEILFKKPELFDHYIIISPSLWWDDESLLQLAPAAFQSPKSIYVGVGKEGEIMERDARDLHQKLEALQRKNVSLFFGFFEALDHGDTLHLAVYEAFKKLFAEP